MYFKPSFVNRQSKEYFENAVRKAISPGGDSDTLACMAGAISQAYYKSIPKFIIDKVYESLDDRLGRIAGEFTARSCKDLL
jgi:ADP-ribosylglycohydrolase